jgi:sugar phosphate permease
VAAPPKLGSLASGAYVTFYYLGGSAAGVAPGLLWPYAHWAGCVALVVCTGLVTMALALRFWADATPAHLRSGRSPSAPVEPTA